MKTSERMLSPKYFTRLLFFIFFLIFNLGINNKISGEEIYSTNQDIAVQHNGTFFYCVGDPIDLLIGSFPDNRSFSGPGIIDLIPNDGRATFDPSIAGVGTHIIQYHNKNFTFRVTPNPITPTLAPFGTYCSYSPAFTLSGGLPYDPTGQYYVEGVPATIFNPSVEGPGTYGVMYSVGEANHCYATSNIQYIVVTGSPVVFNQPATPVCANSDPIDLSLFVSPAGGSFSGTGVFGNIFDPSTVAAPGSYTVRYTFVTGSCTYYVDRTIAVNPAPVITITGLNINHCDNDPDYNFTYSPVSGPGGSGVLIGAGITDLGSGNARFSPSTAGLGYHTFKYTFTDINGCVSSQEMLLRVGTDIQLTGLGSGYCSDAAPIIFNYSHWGGAGHTLTISGGAGLTDNGNGSAVFNPSVAGVGNYTITYSYIDDLTCLNRIDHFVQVLPVPVAQFSGLDPAYCEGAADVSLTGNPPGGTFSGPAGSILNSGGGLAVFRPLALAPGGPYPITYSFTNSSGCSDEEIKNVIINALPASYLVTGTGSYCQGSGGMPVTLFDSDPGVNYQLLKNGLPDGPSVPGTGNAITWSGRTAGNYTVTASVAATGCYNTMNGSASIIELAQAVITKMPAAVTVCETGPAIFSITATGQNLSYAWTKNSVPVGGNSDILTLPAVGTADNGHIIICTVSSTCGGPLVSTPVTLTVLPTTTITVPPVSAVKCSNGSVSFSVVAAGSGLNYQWRKDGADIADLAGKISGSKTSSISISSLVAADEGSYTCFVTGTCGTAISNPADLQVDDPIVVTLQPVNKSVCLGDNTSFNVTATGTNLAYQWYFNNNPVTGATNPIFPLNPVALSDAGTYYCAVSSPCGQIINTNIVSLVIRNATAISSNPAGSTVCQGGSKNFTVVASGSNLTYQWIKDGTPLNNNARITGATLASLAITGLTLADAGNYVCLVSGDCGSISTPAATLYVEQAVTFNSQPANRTVCPGSDATFSVSVNGTNLSYEWQKNNIAIPGALNPDFTVVAATASDAGNYRCRITNACGSVFSNEVTLTINPVTAITTQPLSLTSCVNLNVSFSVAANGSNINYQWYKGAGIIAGAQSPVLNLMNITTTDAAGYTCVVTGTCGAVTSVPAILTVDVAPVIASHPQSKTVCPGMPADLSVVVPTGTNLKYQWVKDGVNIGSDSPIYSIPSFAAGDAGSYHCNITNNCGTVISNTAILSVGSEVNITSNPVPLTACTGGTANFSVTASGSGLSFQWQKDGVPLSNGGKITGALTATLMINGIVPADNGNYRCVVTNSCNSQFSASASLIVSLPALITLQPQSKTACIGDPLNIVTIASGTNLTYQWYKDGAPVGTDNAAYTIAGYAVGDAGIYRCEVTNGCGTVVSDNALISTGITTSITTHPVSAVRCTGSDANFFVSATGSNLTWQWKKDGVSISDDARITGSNSNSLSISGVLIGDFGTYTCNAIGTCGTITSNGAVLTVLNPVSITSQPANLIACNGDNAVFSVTATGDNLTYSWQKNGLPIVPAQTSSSLILTGVDDSNEGVYNCIVSNSCSSEISTSADLVVDDNLVINTHPSPVTQCEGTNVSFTVMAAGPPNTAYQWYKDGSIIGNNARISGASSPVLDINSIVPADAGSYSCRLTSSCGFDETDIAVLTVQENVTITVSPVSFSVLTGNTATFTCVAEGDITGYQWRKDGVDLVNGGNISGVLTANLTIANTTIADEGAYTCFVTGICNNIPSNPANLTVLTTSAITVQPVASVTVCAGGTLNLFITTSGSGHTYQWKRDGINLNNGGNISGADASSLTVSNLTTANQGAYTCVVDGIESSTPSVVIVNPSTIITLHPADAVRCVNGSVTFTVAAEGAVLTYQWQKNMVNIPGATNSSYTIDPLADGDDGVYTCVVTGICGLKTSNPATLIVNKNTVITSHPTGSVICEGNSITLSVAADGDNLNFQWKKNGSVFSDNLNISGTLTNSLVISNAMPADGGIYSCTVTGACGNETSNFAALVVNPTTRITVQPIGRVKCSGDNIVFAINASGQNLLYQWQRNGSDIINDGNITGATTSTLNIASLTQLDHQGTYTCIVTGICGTVTSDPAVLTVSDVTTITVQPAPISTICQGSSVSLNINASGGNLSYQWYKNGSVINNTANISGTNSDNLVISNALISDAGFYTCIVTGTCESVTSNLAVLQVNPTTVINSHPVGQTLCEGDNVQFMVSAVGAGPLTYEWKKDNVPIPLATSSTLTLNGISTSDAGAYSCSVTGSCGVANSNPANLIVNPQITISVQPVNASVCENNTAIFSLNATGTNLIYKWKYNNANITDDGRITGSATNELRIAFATAADEGIYKCEITSTCGILESNSVILSVDDLTTIVTHPVNQTVVQGSTTSFSISASGIVTGYQWRKDGSNLSDGPNITGSNSTTINLTNVAVSDAGSYQCVVTGKCGQAISNPGILTVNVPVTITTPPLSQIKCSGESVSFSVSATGSILSYQWKLNGSNLTDGINISGSKTPDLVIASVDITYAGLYTCVVTGSFNTANSPGAVLTVNEAGVITDHPDNKNICEGDWLVLEVAASGSGLTYSWEKNNMPLTPGPSISGINGPLLVITNVTSADAGSYRCVISNPCKTETSNPAIVTINPNVSFTAHPVSDSKCELQTTSFSVIANGININYQWFKNGVPLSNTARITGVTTSNLMISNLTIADQGNYYCYISDNCSSEYSATAALTIRGLTTLTSQPVNKSICEGENAFFEVTAVGDNLLYQWEKDGVPVSDNGITIFGSNSSVLTIQNTTISNQGVYRCLVTGSCNSVLSNPANLAVNPLPGPAGSITGDNVICQSEKNVLYVVPEITNATSYVWTLPYGAAIVSGSGTRSILVDFSKSSTSGIVSVHGMNACGNGPESPLLTVTVNSIPVANAGPDQILCTDATTFNANITIFGVWTRISGMATIADPDLPNSTVTGLGQGTNSFVWTVSENGCSAKDTVNISNKMVFVDAGADQTICSSTTALNANAPVSGQGSWSVVAGGGTFTSNTNPKTTVINLARGTNILRWSINNNGCVSYDEVIIINDLPSIADAGPDVIILVDNYTLSGNIPAIGTGYWTLLSGSATITDPSLNNTTVTNLGIEENIFRWTITNNLCSTHDDVKIINYTPTLTDAGPDQTLCAERTTLQGIRPNYGTGQWSVIAGSGSFVDPQKFDTEVLNIGKGQNIYRWTIYEYQVSYDDVVITNNSPSYANAGIDQRLCGVTATLAGNNPVVGTGVWTMIGGSGVIANPGIYNSALSSLGPGSNTFRWTITNSGCSSFDEVVIINDEPTSAIAGVDQITCEDFVNLYPNTPTIGVGEWSVVQGSAFFVDNKASNLARGENLLKWTISNNGCYDSDTVSIISNKPTVSYTGEDKSICVDNIMLPGNTPAFGTGVWTILYGSATFEDVTKPNSLVTGLAVGQNRFRWTITYNGCISYSEVDINYNYIQSDAGLDQALCQTNALLNANNPGAGTGQWSVVGGSGSANFLNPDQPNTEVINLDKGVNILRWTITNGDCISYDDVAITNNTPSTAYAGSDRSVCGEEIILNANNPAIGTGQWIVLSGSANIANPALYNSGVTNLSIGQNVLRWTITNQNCTSSDEVVIKNDQPSNIEAGPDQFNCSTSAQLYASAPVGGYGRWSISDGSATFTDNTLFNTMVSNLERGENVLVWTVTIAGCSNSDTVIIANNLPSNPNAGPDQDVCADNAIMSANQPLIGTGRWSIVSGSAVFDDRTLPGAKASNLGNGPNTLRWTITNGSCVLYDEVIIQNSLPTVAYAGEDRAVCNTTANLLAAAPVSGTGSWSVVSGYGVFADPRRFDTQINALGFGQNTLRWTTENGRCRTSDDVIITNNLAEAYAGLDQVVYASDVRLVGNNPSSGIGQWIILAGRGTIQNPSNFETNVSNLGGGANTFSWTINNDGCIASDDVVITNKILPVADFDPIPGRGCAPLTVSFVNNSIGGAPFTWDFGDGSHSGNTNTNHTYTIPGNYRVRLTATGPDGFLVVKDTIVIVYEIPVAQFKVSTDTAYVPGNSVNFLNLTEDIDSLKWEFGDGNISREINPSYKYTSPGTYDVTLSVWSGFQCFDSVRVTDAIIVERAGIIKCPNAFTPNLNGPSGGQYNQNDFSNDVFHCFTEGVKEYHLEIYNRLGIIIFRSDDINIGWDGYFKGKLVEEGAYVFKTFGKYNNGERFDFVGNIVLIH